MKNKLQNIADVFFTRQFLTFLVIGGLNTVNGIIFPSLLSLVLQENLAYSLSYIPSLGVSYILNSFFTFKDKHLTFGKYIRFVLSYVPNFLIQNSVLFICFNLLHANKYIGIILASVLGIPITFLLLKFVAFKKNEE